METAVINGTPLNVSRVALGTWAIGGWMWGGTDEDASIATIEAAVEQGINLIDTAPVYGFGRSEEIVGKALTASGLRSRVHIATKVGLEWRDGRVFTQRQPPAHHRRAQRITSAPAHRLHRSLPGALAGSAGPIEETAAAMRTLYERGRVRAIGVSNFSVEQIERFRQVAPLHAVQPPYNLFERGIEADLLPYCRADGIAVLVYGALCRGLLSGKITAATRFGGDDLRKSDPKFKAPRFAQYLAAVDRLDRFAQEQYGKGIIHLAVRWMLDQGATTALWGARRADQLEPIKEVMCWSLDDSGRREIDRILHETITDPVGPEFMAPATRSAERVSA